MYGSITTCAIFSKIIYVGYSNICIPIDPEGLVSGRWIRTKVGEFSRFESTPEEYFALIQCPVARWTIIPYQTILIRGLVGAKLVENG